MHRLCDETESFVQIALIDHPIVSRHVCGASVMEQLLRQIGVVIGLTMFLTFPVTMVSGAKSQKHSDHGVRFGGETVSVRMPEVSRAKEHTDRVQPMRHEPRR